MHNRAASCLHLRTSENGIALALLTLQNPQSATILQPALSYSRIYHHSISEHSPALAITGNTSAKRLRTYTKANYLLLHLLAILQKPAPTQRSTALATSKHSTAQQSNSHIQAQHSKQSPQRSTLHHSTPHHTKPPPPKHNHSNFPTPVTSLSGQF